MKRYIPEPGDFDIKIEAKRKNTSNPKKNQVAFVSRIDDAISFLYHFEENIAKMIALRARRLTSRAMCSGGNPGGRNAIYLGQTKHSVM
jgi:hypothetical protein